VNYLLIESLQKFHHYYGEDFLVPCHPGRSNQSVYGGGRISKRLDISFFEESTAVVQRGGVGDFSERSVLA
jgi:hypothetical protein